MVNSKTKRRPKNLLSCPSCAARNGLDIPLIQSVRCGAKADWLFVHSGLTQRPFNVSSLGFRSLFRKLYQRCSSHCPDSSLPRLRAQLHPKFLSAKLPSQHRSFASLRDQLSFLLGERGIDMQREFVAIPSESCNHEMHSRLHQPGNEMYVARQAVES